MHDFAPQHQNATFLSFRAGQVIHVLNRDSSGWWDGELEGRRGWFPSNYVNSDVNALVDEEPVASPTPRVQGHVRASSSVSSAASWVARSSPRPSLSRRPSLSEALGPDIDSYCPPIMVPLLHGLSLLQSAVRANRVSHFQPSTAGIISCVRSVLSATDTLVRDAPILHRFPALAQERRRILSVLASLVAQAKKASDETPDEENQEAQVDDMVRLGGQVFVSVRRFLAVAVQCGVELPERRQSVGSLPGSTDTEGHWWSNSDSLEARTVFYGHGTSGSYGLDGILGRTPTPRRVVLADQGSALRSRSMVDLRRSSRASAEDDFDSAVPLLPNGINIPAKTEQEQDLFKERVLRHKASVLSVSSTSSSSSYSSLESTSTPARPSFPVGSSSTAQVMDALRSTHDQYLSTITAFIGHAHSHSRTSHASSTGHMYELVREIVEMVCKLLTIVDAVLQHPDVPANKLGNLQAAKDGLYNVTSTLAESVHLLTVAVDPTKSEEDEKQTLLRSATGALKSGADCVAAVKMCLNRSLGERPFVLLLPNDVERMSFTPSKFAPETALVRASSIGALNMYRFSGIIEEENVVRQRAYMYPVIPENRLFAEESSWSVSSGISSKSSSMQSQETGVTSPNSSLLHLAIAKTMVDPSLPSPTSLEGTDGDGTTWEGSRARATEDVALEAKIFHGDLPAIPLEPILQHPVAWMLSHDYSLEDVAYNTEGHLVGATMDVLVEKMTPHDSIIDPAFSAVFFLTFRLFSSPIELVDTIIQRYNLVPPDGISAEDVQLWQQCKGIPVRLRVSNFIKIWVEIYWRPGVDDSALEPLATFTQNGLAVMFPGRAQRIKDLIELRRQTAKSVISPKSERTRDPGMSINPPSATVPVGEIPRPLMTKTLLANLRAGNFVTIAITDFDPLELARQLTIMECNLYCAIQPEEVLETGQEGVKPPLNVKAVSSLSTAITGWVAESILSEPDIKKRTQLIKFFIKVADRCTSLNNYSTPRSMLAALDSSTISRLHQTWLGLPQKNRSQLVALRRLADHSRNYHEYRSKLRNTAPPAVPFLGLYLTDVTFCREGNPSHRASPMNPERKLLNFNKYHKLARIVQDMQRFQVPYHLRPIPEVQQYLTVDFNKAKHHGDLQDLYRRSLLVEPRQAADTAAPDMQQLFGWTTPSQATTPS
ncbi:ras guanine nucleotide exchange factor domain-containing protein [Mycena metata]|uniref:Ras guanine nucleotide exchange factor domain-containing protein n=1 Tax=Mycena metata TaxID=1033252 RepID=A0AAD7IL29_9AGAR|nr:ras guanine nucleotide exchange factor domain-containing protein [Mycena metata]